MASELGYQFTFGARLAPSFKGAMSAAQSQVAGLAQRVRRLESSDTGRLGGAFEAQRRKIAGFGKELREAQEQLRGLWSRAEAAGTMSATMTRQIEQAERRVAGLTQSLRRSSATYREHIASIRTAEGSVGNLRRKYQALSADMDRARRSQAALSANLAQKAALRDERADLRGRIVGTVGMGMAAAAPAALSIGFEDSMARVGALANASGEDLARLTAQARQLGRDTVYTASQAAEGMGYLAMAGFNTEQTLAAMPGMLALAAAGNTDLGRTADIASNILSGFKMKAQEMGEVSDVLAKAFTSSNTTLETLGETMKYVGPVASSVGLSVQDTAAAAGLLGNVGIQGSQAGTALRAALLRLAAPPKMAKEALADLTGTAGPELDELYEQMEDVAGAQQTLSELGMSTKDAQGNLRPLVEILEELNAKTRAMGTGERAEVFKKVFGTEASAAMIALADAAGKTVDDMGNRIVDGLGRPTTAMRKYMGDLNAAGGTAARISKQMNDTTGGELRRLKSAWEDVGISVGNLFLPAIRGAATGLTGLGNGLSWFVQTFPGLSKGIALVGGGIVGLAVASLVLGYAFNTVRTGLVMARGAMLLFSGAQMATTGTTRALTLSQNLSRLATMSWRDALIGGRAAIVGLAGRVAAFAGIQRGATLGTVAFTVAQKGMAAAGAIAGGGLRVLGMAVRFALGPLGLILTALSIGVGLIIDNWDTVGPYFTAVWDGITGTFRAAWDFIRGIIDKVAAGIGWIGEQIDKIPVLGSAKRGLGAAWDWAFGEDEDSESAPESPSASAAPLPAAPQAPSGQAQQALMSSSAASPSVGQAVRPAPSSSGTAGLVNVPQRAAAQNAAPRPRQASASQALDLEQLSAMSGTNISMDMQFQVQGLDSAVFRQKINECRKDFEAIVRRVVDDMQHQKTRTAYAQ